MYKIISDESQIKFFFDNIMKPFKDSEAYFMSLAARNKYLTEEEKEFFKLGRNEMFCSYILNDYNYNKFLTRIKKYECNEEGYITKNLKSIPQKCLVCYMNINPSSTIKALYEFRRITEEYYQEYINSYMKKIFLI